MKFAGFLCLICLHDLSLALPSDLAAKDVQTQRHLVKENEDTKSVSPEEINKYYWSKQESPIYGYIWRYKLVPVVVDPYTYYTLPEDQRGEVKSEHVQENLEENEGKTSTDNTLHRLKRQANWGLGASISIPLGGGGVPRWSVQSHLGQQNPSFGWGVRAGVGGEFGRPPATSFGGYLSGTDQSGLTGVIGGGWHSRAGTTFGLGADYRGLGGHIDHQNGRFSAGAGSMPNLDPSRIHNPLHGSHG